MNVIAVCSMLHESADDNSVTRRFRGEPVLRWTLRRLAQTTRVRNVVVLAWDDQLDGLADVDVSARAGGARRPTPQMTAVAAAQRWADGWRGGLLQSCPFDNGFSADLLLGAMKDDLADAAVLIDPAAGLVDPAIVDDIVAAAEAGPRDFYFTQAAPGLGGVLLKRTLVDRLTVDRMTPGKLVHYLPDAPRLDPITSDACVDVPLDVSRVAGRFTLDSQRQIEHMEQATVSLNGTLISSRASAVVRRVAATPSMAVLPRDIVLELTPRRDSRPVFGISSHVSIDRPDLSPDHFDALLSELSRETDVRVTLAGVGDPLLHLNAIEFIRHLSAVAAVSIETDLLSADDTTLTALAASGVDVIAVHLPATSPDVYRDVMGVDGLATVVDNIRRLLEARQKLNRGTPVVTPLFTKVLANFDEMEGWYDTWLRAIGSAVIVGPTSFGGRVRGVEVADMTPPVRRPCVRLGGRLTILSSGAIVACEQDAVGEMPLGRLGVDRIADVWAGPRADLKTRHGRLAQLPDLCTRCSEWHRP